MNVLCKVVILVMDISCLLQFLLLSLTLFQMFNKGLSHEKKKRRFTFIYLFGPQ